VRNAGTKPNAMSVFSTAKLKFINEKGGKEHGTNYRTVSSDSGRQ
jgi:hypothetical protein